MTAPVAADDSPCRSVSISARKASTPMKPAKNPARATTRVPRPGESRSVPAGNSRRRPVAAAAKPATIDTDAAAVALAPRSVHHESAASTAPNPATTPSAGSRPAPERVAHGRPGTPRPPTPPSTPAAAA